LEKKKIILILAAICAVVALISRTKINKNLELNSKEVTDLYHYLGEVDINHCGGLITYSNKSISYSELNNENRLCMAYYQLENNKKEEKISDSTDKKEEIKICKVGENTTLVANEEEKCPYTTFQKDDLNKAYKSIYGKNMDEDSTFYISNKEACYREGDTYYCGTAETFTYYFAPETTIYRLMNKAIKNHKGEIILYDYFLKISDNKCYATNSSEESEDCSKALENQKEINSEFIKKYGTIYKHTFKKDANNNYYWYKTELKK